MIRHWRNIRDFRIANRHVGKRGIDANVFRFPDRDGNRDGAPGAADLQQPLCLNVIGHGQQP